MEQEMRQYEFFEFTATQVFNEVTDIYNCVVDAVMDKFKEKYHHDDESINCKKKSLKDSYMENANKIKEICDKYFHIDDDVVSKNFNKQIFATEEEEKALDKELDDLKDELKKLNFILLKCKALPDLNQVNQLLVEKEKIFQEMKSIAVNDDKMSNEVEDLTKDKLNKLQKLIFEENTIF